MGTNTGLRSSSAHRDRKRGWGGDRGQKDGEGDEKHEKYPTQRGPPRPLPLLLCPINGPGNGPCPNLRLDLDGRRRHLETGEFRGVESRRVQSDPVRSRNAAKLVPFPSDASADATPNSP